MDLLGETASGELVHIELQSTNDLTMPLRMAEYYLRIYRLFRKLPRQFLLYVGQAPLRMGTGLIGPGMSFRFDAVDIRALDGERLLESSDAGDNVIAILAGLRDHRDAVRRILTRIAGLKPGKREIALTQLIALAGLRRLEEFIELEARKMPLLDDIMDNKVLGRERRIGLEQGKQEGILEGELTVLRRQIEIRFGPVPAWAEERLRSRSARELEALSVRLFGATSLDDFLK